MSLPEDDEPRISARPALWFTAAVLGAGVLLLLPIVLILLFSAP